MTKYTLVAFTAIAILLPCLAQAALFGKDKDIDEQRQEVLDMRADVLGRLYEEKPSVENMIKGSVGYAVFSNTGINVLMLSTANGKGIAHDNKSGKDVYMNMISAGGGLGLGVKKFSAVFVFHHENAFDQFVEEGWNLSGQADAAATTDSNDNAQPGSEEAALTFNDGVSVFQMTEKGLALQVTLQGTKYWKDEDLN